MDPLMDDYQKKASCRVRRVLFLAAVLLLLTAGRAAAAGWQGAFNASYQAAQPGDTIVVPSAVTSLSGEVIQWRGSVANLAGGCTPADTSKCIRIVVDHPVTVNGVLEVRGSSLWVDGGAAKNLRVTGYVDVEADSNTNHPDHVILSGWRATSFGVFNADTVTMSNFDVGPSTAYWNGSSPVCCRQGRGFENKIGFGGDVTYVPRNVTIDGGFIHDQNGDSSRLQPGADVHFGGLFLVTVDGLTVRNTVFEANVVYHVQIQNFEGPRAKRVVFDNNSFSCPVDWLYAFGCDGQRAIQFDYDPGAEFTLTNNVAANGANGLYGCYVGTCGGLTGVKTSGNVNLANSTTAPPLGGTPPPPPPAACSDGIDNDGDGNIDMSDPGCSSATDTDETDPAPPPVCTGSGGTSSLSLTKLSETSNTITLGWTPVPGAVGYRFATTAAGSKYSTTNDPLRSSVKFGKIAAGGCYYVLAQMPGAGGGFKAD